MREGKNVGVCFHLYKNRFLIFPKVQRNSSFNYELKIRTGKSLNSLLIYFSVR